jgi:hypothetical protein
MLEDVFNVTGSRPLVDEFADLQPREYALQLVSGRGGDLLNQRQRKLTPKYR